MAPRGRIFLVGGAVVGDDFFGGAEAVDGGSDDAAGVAGAFTDGVDAGHFRDFHRVWVAVDSNGGAAAHFGACENGIGEVLSAPLFVHQGESFLDGSEDNRGEHIGQVAWFGATFEG